MRPIDSYVRFHLAGAAAGIDLATRCARVQPDPQLSAVVREIRDELIGERRQLRQIAGQLGTSESALLSSGARMGEHMARFAPHRNHWKSREWAALIDLEAMRIAVSGQICGWEALLEVVDDHECLDRDQLQELLDLARDQLSRLSDAHRQMADQILGDEHK